MKIEKGIPIPMSYPFAAMDVGDSVLIEGQGSNGKAAMAAHACGKYHRRRFSCRSVGNDVRIWRLA